MEYTSYMYILGYTFTVLYILYSVLSTLLCYCAMCYVLCTIYTILG